MRRLVPYLLLGLLTAGTVVGIVLGVVNRPEQTPAQFVSAALASTADAGTARFAYSHVTTSPNPQLRSTVSGSGAVDFHNDATKVTELSRESNVAVFGPRAQRGEVPQTSSLLQVGSTTYMRLGPSPRWIQTTIPRRLRAQFPLDGALNAAVALSGLNGATPVASVQKVGSATLDGVPTTEYTVRDEPPVLCPGARRSTTDAFAQLPSTLWLNAQGRIVRARTEFRSDFQVPKGDRTAFPAALTGRSTTVAVLRFRDFGSPVSIAAPPSSEIQSRSGSGSATITLRSCAR